MLCHNGLVDDGEISLPQVEAAIPRRYVIIKEEASRRQYASEMAKFIENVSTQHPDVLVFLDKSARPASWLFHEMWLRLQPGTPEPEVEYINLGREKGKDKGFTGWRAGERQIRHYQKQVKADKVLVRKLREHFAIDSNSNAVSRFDNKSIWIVDEFAQTGRTLLMAQALFEEAFKGHYAGEIEYHNLFSSGTDWAHKVKLIGITDPDNRSFRSVEITPQPAEEIQLRNEMRWCAEDYMTRQAGGTINTSASSNP